ncbi:MAG: hypothetical protein ACREDY_13490, partial [Bradyrhizobium sp.]
AAVGAAVSRWSLQDRVDALRDVPLAPGWWLARYHMRAPALPCMIELCDHEPGDPENKVDQPYFIAAINGRDCDPHEVVALKNHIAITPNHYRFLIAELAWSKQYAPEEVASERKPDLMTALPPFAKRTK